jgi:hypothetical protein
MCVLVKAHPPGTEKNIDFKWGGGELFFSHILFCLVTYALDVTFNGTFFPQSFAGSFLGFIHLYAQKPLLREVALTILHNAMLSAAPCPPTGPAPFTVSLPAFSFLPGAYYCMSSSFIHLCFVHLLSGSLPGAFHETEFVLFPAQPLLTVIFNTQ